MSTVVEQALDLWGLAGAEYSLVAARENAVYRVSADGKSYALRLHRQGYRCDAELWSELMWMDALSKAGISVPTPIPSTSGEVLHLVDGIQVDVLSWLHGATVANALAKATPESRKDIFGKIGREMARMHSVSDAWDLPPGFRRCAWDREGLVGDAPLWDRFWCNPSLTEADQELFLNFRAVANVKLGQHCADLDYGLIHADLVGVNILLDDDRLHLIDFDDGGFGFRIFDIATALLKHMSEPDYPSLRAALLDGYRSERPINLADLDLFLALRAVTYVGWNVTRMSEEGASARNDRFIDQARLIVRDYLKTQH